MSSSFGIDFILVNDIQQVLPPAIFRGGPWLHIATIVRGLREYICFKNTSTDKVYIEEIDSSSPTLFKHISDTNEWNDLYMFLQQKGILAYGANREIKVAKQKK